MKRNFISKIQRITLLACTLALFTNAYSQGSSQTRKILDKTAAIVGRPGGASARFTIANPKIGKSSGTISVKGNKFHARTPQAIVWFDGKNQWSYLRKTNEVSISHPSRSQQMSMNPYTFINMYRSGYKLSHKVAGNNYQVRMLAQDKRNGIPEMYILINRKNFVPVQVKMRQDNVWTTIGISNFQGRNIPNSTFVFRPKDLPSAEVIDLR